MAALREVADRHGIPVHLDGARLFNAAVALGVEAREIARFADSVSVCLSKGLGAPVGSLLAGPKSLIDEARRWRKRLGGGMRQAGVIAAPALLALTKMVDRLAEDHKNAKRLACALAETKGFSVDPDQVETNIVLADISDTGKTAEEVLDRLAAEGVLAVSFGPTTLRFVTHKDVSRKDIDEAVLRIRRAVDSF